MVISLGKRWSLLALLAAVAWPATARAHDFWVEREGGAFLVRYGHHGGRVLPLEAGKVRSLVCRNGKGAADDLLAAAVSAPKQLSVKASCAVVTAHFDGGFYALTPDGEKNLPKNRVPDAVKSWRSRQYAKWIDIRSPLAAQPTGEGMEIVPVSDLTRARTGDKATFRVLLEGKPLPGAVLAIEHKSLGETDDDGQVRVKIRGRDVESVGASFRRAVKTAEADSEVFEASLTFEVAR